jgi:hypothetical protein
MPTPAATNRSVPGSDYRAWQKPVLELQWLLGKKALEGRDPFPTRHELKAAAAAIAPDSTVRDEDRVGGGWGPDRTYARATQQTDRQRTLKALITEMPTAGSRCVYTFVKPQARA